MSDITTMTTIQAIITINDIIAGMNKVINNQSDINKHQQSINDIFMSEIVQLKLQLKELSK